MDTMKWHGLQVCPNYWAKVGSWRVNFARLSVTN